MDALVSNIAKKKHKKKNVKKKPGKAGKAGAEKPARHNSKAFTFSGGRRSVHRRVQHASEVEEKRLRRPRVHKSPESPPPLVVVVQGPKSVGKSTLIASLVKQYSRRNIANVNGPITLVSSKARRVTLVECGSSMVDMIDCCKVADVALVMIDASYGYEMETFEFVNMMQVHGFPRVIGVLTHLDAFNDNKTLRRTKKVLKKRFWSEIYDGAKMFYMSGLQYERYKKAEVLNLARYISSQKPPSISWRLSHPYTVSLRHEVVESEGDTCRVLFYGYVYGGKLNASNRVHIPGAGDFEVASVTNFQDPCEVHAKEATLKDRNRNIYAPYCDVGALVLDDDAMYIQLFRTKEHFTEMPGEDGGTVSEAVQMVRTLQKIDLLEPSQVRLQVLDTAKPADDPVESSGGDESGLDREDYNSDPTDDEDIEDESDSDDQDDDSEDGHMYGQHSGDDEFGTKLRARRRNLEVNGHGELEDEDTDSTDDSDEESEETEEEDDEDEEQVNEIEIYDDISQRVYFGEASTEEVLIKDFSKVMNLEVGVRWDEESLRRLRETKFSNLADENENEEEETENDPESDKFRRVQEEEQRRMYQEAVELDATGNVGHFVKICVAGVPRSFIDRVDTSRRPIVVGALQPAEQGCGFIQLKLRRHRWSPKILKTNDPLLFSVGWRRFQSLPVYCMEDRNQTRVKMLKYTPEHMHCLANIYGPLSPPNFGILAVRNWERISNFRISATGVIVGTSQSYRVMKKLKLIGEPYKILKNTCFIRNMFTSELEVIRCLGSKIQTASGVRGQIKKAVDKNGAFRATFEDKILLSDLVILKSWVPVETKQFYNLMLDSDAFKRVKSISELRTHAAQRPDSRYEPKALLRRPVRRFNEIRIPKPIVEKLPFSSRPKVVEPVKEDVVVAVEPSEHDRRMARMFQKLHTIRKERLERREEAARQYKLGRARAAERLAAASQARLRDVRRARHARRSKAEQAKRAKLLLD